jgi:hypothetical protein
MWTITAALIVSIDLTIIASRSQLKADLLIQHARAFVFQKPQADSCTYAVGYMTPGGVPTIQTDRSKRNNGSDIFFWLAIQHWNNCFLLPARSAITYGHTRLCIISSTRHTGLRLLNTKPT